MKVLCEDLQVSEGPTYPACPQVPPDLQKNSNGLGGPPYCNSGIIGVEEDPDIITSVPHSHHYRVGGLSTELMAREGAAVVLTALAAGSFFRS